MDNPAEDYGGSRHRDDRAGEDILSGKHVADFYRRGCLYEIGEYEFHFLDDQIDPVPFNYGKDMARSRGQDERPGTKSKDRQE